MAKRDDFRAGTIRQLAQRVGYICSKPGCNQITIGPQKGSKGVVLLGEAAHICAAAEGGPRYDPRMTQEERKSYENGIWLCPKCASLIDRDEKYYTVNMLHKWKAQAEEEAGKRLENIEKANHTNETILTDDEKIVLCYMLTNQLIKASKAEIESWCKEEEIHKVNLENARILLSKDEDTTGIILDLSQFRELLRRKEELIQYYYLTVDQHRKLAVDRILDAWDSFSDAEKMFVNYIRANKLISFGDRWVARDIEIPNIERWEQVNDIGGIVSNNYGTILSDLIDKMIVYESNWTSFGNPKEYTLYKSASDFFLADQFEFEDEINDLMRKYIDLPF